MKSNIKQYPSFLSNTIPNPKERKRIIEYLVLTASIVGAGTALIALNYQSFLHVDEDTYKGFFKQFGSVSRIIYFIVLSIFPVFQLLKWKGLRGVKWRNLEIKGLVQQAGKLLRKWHVPLALLATAVVIFHVILAVMINFHWDFTNITGILTSMVLGFLIFMGFRRFKRKDGAWHLKLAVAFTVLFMIHASF
ncbi:MULTISPECIES: hypothetical protein [Bacillaceae]|uniref:hypothetical protein n=1 Tax=Bacillaceae TaxID=186817 RepID=UPI001C5954C2|nr:hypothetical protein [Rossellomorea sp. YZS02]MBW3113170.1 hypothetical protein [Bacillus sp. MCCB 382]MDX8343770.1 hypothetical protein [Rossellomorea sp. YZS02]